MVVTKNFLYENFYVFYSCNFIHYNHFYELHIARTEILLIFDIHFASHSIFKELEHNSYKLSTGIGAISYLYDLEDYLSDVALSVE
jgi:hypothetical protein